MEEAAVAAAAAASAMSSKHDPAKGQWDFAQRAQRAALAEEQAAAASGVKSSRKVQHQRHGSASDREGPAHRKAAEVLASRMHLAMLKRCTSCSWRRNAFQGITHSFAYLSLNKDTCGVQLVGWMNEWMQGWKDGHTNKRTINW